MTTEDYMINDRVPYSFRYDIKYATIVGITIKTEIISGERTGVFTERTYTIKGDDGGIRSGYTQDNFEKAAAKRLEKLREALEDESISGGELIELQSLVPYIAKDDVQLLQAAGVPEFEEAE